MKIHESVFVFGYLLNKKLHPGTSSAEWSSCIGLSLFSIMNLLTVDTVIFLITGNRELSFMRSPGGYIIAVATLVLWSLVFLRNKRYLTVMKLYDQLEVQKKKQIWNTGVAYYALSFIAMIGAFALLVDW